KKRVELKRTPKNAVAKNAPLPGHKLVAEGQVPTRESFGASKPLVVPLNNVAGLVAVHGGDIEQVTIWLSI
ncbi:MAG: hypothetical protein ABSG14_03840, partial [Verrucomicrobiia bacterium]